MTRYGQTGSAFSYKTDFVVDGELVSPTSAKITVQKNDGSATSVTDVALSMQADDTSASYVIPASVNNTTLPQEIRYITVKFTYEGVEYVINDLYFLRSSLLIPTTKADVRALVAMSTTELPDENIDLFYAYSELDSDLEGTLASLISAGSLLIPKIQKALTAKAAFNSCQMIEMMYFQSEQADNTTYKRFSKVDFEALLARLDGIYNDALVEVTGTDTTIPSLFIVATGTDVITGA